MGIFIIGGGMTGLVAANLLLAAGFEVNISEIILPLNNNLNQTQINTNSDNNFNNFNNFRVSALTPVSVRLLQQLNSWPNSLNAQTGKFNRIQIDYFRKNTDSFNNYASLIFDGSQIGQLPLGYIIENNLLRKLLWNTLNNKFELNKNITQESADLVIGADGADSAVRKAANINCDIKDYHQSAIIAVIKTSQPHDNIARQIFLPSGPLAFLPLANHYYYSIVWSLDYPEAVRLLEAEVNTFEKSLEELTNKTVGKVALISERLSFPLKMQHAQAYVKPKLALIGDAAHTVHPLAGYGVNMGFLDVLTLVKILKTARLQQRNIGNLQTLKKYERVRLAENNMMLKIIDSFTKSAISDIGLNFTRKSRFLQNTFMQWMSHHGQANIAV